MRTYVVFFKYINNNVELNVKYDHEKVRMNDL